MSLHCGKGDKNENTWRHASSNAVIYIPSLSTYMAYFWGSQRLFLNNSPETWQLGIIIPTHVHRDSSRVVFWSLWCAWPIDKSRDPRFWQEVLMSSSYSGSTVPGLTSISRHNGKNRRRELPALIILGSACDNVGFFWACPEINNCDASCHTHGTDILKIYQRMHHAQWGIHISLYFSCTTNFIKVNITQPKKNDEFK